MGPGHWGVWGRVKADPPFRGETYEGHAARRARHVLIAASAMALVPLNYWAIVSLDAVWAVTGLPDARPALGPGGWLWVVVILGLDCLPLVTIAAALWAGGPGVLAGDVVPVVTAALMCAIACVVVAGLWDRHLRLDALASSALSDARNGLAVYLTTAAAALVAAVVRLVLDAAAD